MELTLINDNKLKIMLTVEDMENLDITCEDMDYDDTATRRIFWDLLDRAKRRTGFDAASDKLLVQVYPDKTGGCMMYITKMNGVKQENATYEKKYKTRLYTGKQRKRLIYAVADCEALYDACRQLCEANYSGRSDIYCGSGLFFLCMDECADGRTDIVGEYGQCIRNPMFGYYLSEHCKRLITDNAAEKFYESMSAR